MAALVVFVVFFAGWLGLPVTASASATTVTLKPASYTTLTGTDGGQPVATLHVRDQSGVQNDWDRYIEFTPQAGRRYDGYRRYFVPAHVPTAAITGLMVRANFLGPDKATQRWTWSVYNWRTRAWVAIGDNGGAASWSWTLLRLRATGTLADYVRADTREIRVRLRSLDASDSADLDSEAVVLTVDDVAPPTTIWRPAPNTTWQWQLTALPVDTTVDVEMFDIDLFENSSAVVAALHAAGRKVVCYMSAGSWEDWRPDAAHFPAVILGASNGWPGERWLDIRRLDLLGPIMEARLDLCRAKGFDAVEPDNIDGYTNKTGFPLTAADQLRYNIFLANAAHARGLSIGLKNDVDQIAQLEPYFDWALNEECFAYDECHAYQPFLDAGKAVFHVEYEVAVTDFCPSANALNFNSMKKRWDLDVYRRACR